MRLSAKSRLVSQPPLARVLALGAFLFCGGLLLVAAQKSTQKEKGATAPPTATLLTRSAARHETQRLGYGGTLTVVGAPQGSIVIEGWPRSEIDVTAEIQWQAETEADLDRLAAVNSFAFDEDVNHISILTTGTHDKAFMRRVAKDYPSVTALEFAAPIGKGGALIEGLKLAPRADLIGYVQKHQLELFDEEEEEADEDIVTEEMLDEVQKAAVLRTLRFPRGLQALHQRLSDLGVGLELHDRVVGAGGELVVGVVLLPP